jgi:glucosamine--fructose-6-phosphate aminotransferase (isomerizing)
MKPICASEIDEIPEAAARLLEQSASSLKEAGRGAARKRPGLPRHHRSRFVRPCRTLHQICDRAFDRTAVASLGPSLASIYGAKMKLDHGGIDLHFAIRQEPGHRRDG